MLGKDEHYCKSCPFRFCPPGMRVLAHDVHPKTSEWIEYVTLDRLLAESDVVSLHCPLLPDTKHLRMRRLRTSPRQRSRTLTPISPARRSKTKSATAASVQAERISPTARAAPMAAAIASANRLQVIRYATSPFRRAVCRGRGRWRGRWGTECRGGRVSPAAL